MAQVPWNLEISFSSAGQLIKILKIVECKVGNVNIFLPMMINELDLFVCSIVGEAIVDEDVEAVPLGPHVDGQGDGVTHVDRSSNSVSGQTISGPDLHEAFGRGEGEYHRICCIGSGDR